MDIRLKQNVHSQFTYYNIIVSEYRCLGDNDVGNKCYTEPKTIFNVDGSVLSE